MSIEDVNPQVESVAAEISSMGTRGVAPIARVAAAALGTLACVEAAADQGKSLSVLVRETGPRKRGQVTARRLRELGVPVTRIADGAAGWYLDDADHVFVGADAIATERGQFPPGGIVALMRELFGEGPNRPWEEP